MFDACLTLLIGLYEHISGIPRHVSLFARGSSNESQKGGLTGIVDFVVVCVRGAGSEQSVDVPVMFCSRRVSEGMS